MTLFLLFLTTKIILTIKKKRKRVTKCLEQTKKARCVEGVAGVVVENL